MEFVEGDDLTKTLQELTDAAQRGDVVRVSFRMYRTDGTFEDIVLGAESEEDRQAMLADLRAHIKAGAS